MYTRLSVLTTTLVLLTFSSIVSAGPSGMSEADMQKMMQNADAAQSCFEKIDESQYAALEAKGKKMEQEINALCKAGKDKQANAKAISYSRDILNDPQYKQIQKCAALMPQMEPKPYLPIKDEDDQSGSVCD